MMMVMMVLFVVAVLVTIAVLMSFQQRDASHQHNTEQQRQEQGNAVVPMELHLGQQIRQGDQYERPRRKSQAKPTSWFSATTSPII